MKEADKENKEINLLQLIGILINWIKNLLSSTLKFTGTLLKLVYRHKIISIVIMLIGTSVGLYLSRPSAKVYKAEAMVMLYGCEAQTAKEVCRQLEYSLITNKLTSLSTKLSLPDSIAKNIIAIKSYDVIDFLKDGVADQVDFKGTHSLTDTLNKKMKDRIYIQIKVKKIYQVPTIQNAIINYFNSNPMLRTQYFSKMNEYAQQIKVSENESKRIDSLAKTSYFKDNESQIKFSNNKLIMGEQSKQLFLNELLRLNDIRSYCKSRLADFVQPVVLPSGLVVNPIPENGMVKYSIFGFLIGLAVSVIVSALIENLTRIKKYLEN